MVLGITKVDKEKNRGIRKKTRAQSILKEIKQYQKVATTRTEDGHKQTTKQALQYRPKGRRNTGRPRKRWRD